MVTLMVLKQSGETGLRLPGQVYQESEGKAEKLIASGLAKALQPAASIVKEEKATIETKELKIRKITKTKKRK